MRMVKMLFGMLVATGTIIVLGGLINSTQENMKLDPELQEAWDIINGLQSLFLDDSYMGANTEVEIIALGDKILKIQQAFSHNTDRVRVLRDDQEYFKGKFLTSLNAWMSSLTLEQRNDLPMYPLDTESIVAMLLQPQTYITSFEDYKNDVPELVATEIGMSAIHLPSNNHEIWEYAFEVTKDAREIRARLRGDDWLTNFEKKLCMNESDNVNMIAFSRDTAGKVSYVVTETITSTCQEDFINKAVCNKNQIESERENVLCEYGCIEGRCEDEPDIAISCDNLEVSSSVIEESTEISYTCQATNTSQYTVELTHPDGSISQTRHQSSGTMYIPDAPDGQYTIQCFVEGSFTSDACTKTIQNNPIGLSHFELYNGGPIMTFEGASGEERMVFDLLVEVKNKDGSRNVDYDGKGLIIITGDDSAEFPGQVDLRLDQGLGSFKVTLSQTQDVHISYKDVDNHINGTSAVEDLKLYDDMHIREVCPEEYDPVCGEVIVQCAKSPCYPTKKTFSNMCVAQQGNAINVRPGACPPDNTYIESTGYDMQGEIRTLSCCDSTIPGNMCPIASCMPPSTEYTEWKQRCLDSGFDLVGSTCHCGSRLCTGNVSSLNPQDAHSQQVIIQ